MQNMSRLKKAILATVATFCLLLGISAIQAAIHSSTLRPNWIILIVISLVTGVAWYFTIPGD